MESTKAHRAATPAGIAAAFLVGVAAGLGVLGAWNGAARAPTAAAIEPAIPASRRIDVNSATAAELQLLPRIGPALAQRIVEYRKQHGPFRALHDLERVKGIGPRTIERLEPLITLSFPALSSPGRTATEAR